MKFILFLSHLLLYELYQIQYLMHWKVNVEVHVSLESALCICILSHFTLVTGASMDFGIHPGTIPLHNKDDCSWFLSSQNGGRRWEEELERGRERKRISFLKFLKIFYSAKYLNNYKVKLMAQYECRLFINIYLKNLTFV